ncbi:DUF1376 domain-containing protein [Bartonella sp. B35(2025)]
MKHTNQQETPYYESSTLPYVCWYQNDFLGGVRGMRAHEIGIYTILLNEMYARGRPLKLSVERLARLCGCDKRTFVNVLEMLLREGKILNLAHGLWNKRCENVFHERTKLLEKKSLAGHSSAQKRKKINAKVQQLLNESTRDDEHNLEAQKEEEKETPYGVSEKQFFLSSTTRKERVQREIFTHLSSPPTPTKQNTTESSSQSIGSTESSSQSIGSTESSSQSISSAESSSQSIGSTESSSQSISSAESSSQSIGSAESSSQSIGSTESSSQSIGSTESSSQSISSAESSSQSIGSAESSSQSIGSAKSSSQSISSAESSSQSIGSAESSSQSIGSAESSSQSIGSAESSSQSIGSAESSSQSIGSAESSSQSIGSAESSSQSISSAESSSCYTRKDRKRATFPKGTRLPVDWTADIGAAISEGLNEEQARWQEKKFRDYWRAKSGKEALKVDWQATWRNWFRREIERIKENQERLAIAPSRPILTPHYSNDDMLYRSLINYRTN